MWFMPIFVVKGFVFVFFFIVLIIIGVYNLYGFSRGLDYWDI